SPLMGLLRERPGDTPTFLEIPLRRGQSPISFRSSLGRRLVSRAHGYIQYRGAAGAAWTVARVADHARMGYRHPRFGRDLHMGQPADPLQLYARHYRLTARCRRPGCNHTREIPPEWLLRIFGADA